jgi:hypothetical protein
MIILTAQEAVLVDGPSKDGHAKLEPRALADGTFALPEAVLDDVAHAAHHALLSSLPTRDISVEEWVSSEV